MTDRSEPQKPERTGPTVRTSEARRAHPYRKGTDNLKLAIIAYAKARPCIWDNHINYNKNDRDEAWRSFSEGFSLPVAELRRRWEGMRLAYCMHLKESIAKSSEVDWPYFSKLDDFLRTPTLRSWHNEGTTLEEGSTNRTGDIEYIDLSSDSDSEHNKNKDAAIERVDSSEKNLERPIDKVVTLQTAEDVRNELRKIPPVAGSVGVLQKEPKTGRTPSGMLTQSKPSAVAQQAKSSSASQQSKPSSVSQQSKPSAPRKPSLGLNKKRKSLPDIPDAKRRLIENCGELIALKKMEPNDNLSRSLPLGNPSTISSPPQKMFGSTTANIGPNHKPSPAPSQSSKSILKKMKQKMEKGGKKQCKKRVSVKAAAPPSTNKSGTSTLMVGDNKKLILSSEITKLPPCISLTPSGSELPNVIPSSESVTLHSVPITSREDSRNTNQDVQTNDQIKEHKREKNRHKKVKPHQKGRVSKEVTNVIELDNSDSEVTTSIPDLPETLTISPVVACQQNGLERDKLDSHKAENDLLKKWEQEIKELPKTEDEQVQGEQEKDDPETTRESRKNFLLSFLPDMAEMTVEQRRFFKSKLMFLVCNIDQFS